MRAKITHRALIVFSLILTANSVIYSQDKPLRTIASPQIQGPSSGVNAAHNVNVSAPTPGASTEKIVDGIIRLKVLPNKTTVFMPNNFSLKVDVEIKAYNSQVPTTPFHSIIRSFNIDYSPYANGNNSYKDQDAYIIKGVPGQYPYYISSTIKNIWVNNVAVTNLPANVELETMIDLLRYSNPSTAVPAAPTPNLIDLDCDAISETVEFTWSAIPGAVSYELEWDAINDYLWPTGSKVLTVADFNFKKSASRVSVTTNSYKIPAVFDRGKLACRVRGIFKSTALTPGGDDYRIEGKWSNISALLPVGHHSDMFNWQCNMTFAEEGKNSLVMVYADGSGRDRQTLSKDNSNGVVIATEKIYDFTGRAAISVLPAPLPKPNCVSPTAESSIKYRPGLSVNQSGQPFTKYDFDLDYPTNPCSSPLVPMGTQSGAANYYSSQNPDQNGFQSYIPEAGGFVYSQTEFVGDNSNRVKAKSDFGQEFQLNQGHDTRFFYGVPEQIELDRLFASEVGDASHYQKNLTIDPNGQVNIVYLNMEGKVIATALAGSAPNNLMNLNTMPNTRELVSDLLNKNGNGVSELNISNPDGDGFSFYKSVLVNTPNSANTFTYNLEVDNLKLTCTPNICFNCVYDYEFSISDDCGNQIYPSPAIQGKRMIGKFVIVGNDTIFDVSNCSPLYPSPSPQGLYKYQEITPPIVLNPGVYYVKKKITLNQNARNEYVEKFLDPTNNTCILTLADFENIELAKITDSSSCYLDCSTCESKLGTQENFILAGKGTAEQWKLLVQNCKSLCAPVKGSCDIYLQQLLTDVSPNGQYGNYTDPNDPLSVFNKNNLLPKNTTPGSVQNGPLVPSQTAHWQKPALSASGPFYYVDSQGQRATIKLTKLPNGTTSNPGNFNYALVNVTQTFAVNGSGFYAYPENLANLTDFVINWQPSWAKSLVMFHPEYCYYLDCKDKFSIANNGAMSSVDFDATLQGTKTFAEAVSKNLVSASGVVNLAADPASAGGYFGNAFTSQTPINDIFNTYDVSMGALSMSQFAAYLAKCAGAVGTNQSNLTMCTTFCSASDNTASKDKQWNTYKALYLASKARILAKYSDFARLQSTSCSYYNSCIGSQNFSAYSSPLVVYQGGNIAAYPTSKYYEASQPCNLKAKDLYKNKIKRFGVILDSPEMDQDEIDYQTFLQTGKCPFANDVQNLANALAQNLRLQNQIISSAFVPEPLLGYPQFGNELYNLMNSLPNPPATYINYLWETNLQAGNVLQGNFRNTFTNQFARYINFNPPSSASINWGNVVAISQLNHVSTVGAVYNFTCIAKETVGTTNVLHQITGNTDIPIAGCNFKETCTANDFGLALQNLMTILKANPGPSNSLFYTGAAIGNAAGNTAYAPHLAKVQQVLGLSGNNLSLQWQSTGPNTFEIFDPANPTNCKLKINLLSMSPGAISQQGLSSVVTFNNLKSDYLNYFTMDARDQNGILVGKIKGEVFKECSGQQSAVSCGDCGLPDPAECKSVYHQNRKDLEKLVIDIIINQKFNPGNNNVAANPYLSSNLVGNFNPLSSNLPATKYAVNNTYFQTISGELVPTGTQIANDSISIHFSSPCVSSGGDGGNPIGRSSGGGGGSSVGGGSGGIDDGSGCVVTNYCDLWFKTSYKSTPMPYNLSNLYKIVGLYGYGATTSSGSYTDFYVVAQFTAAGQDSYIYTDTIWGSSCFEIKNCDACGAVVQKCCNTNIGAGPWSDGDHGPSLGGNLGNRNSPSKNTVSESTFALYKKYCASVEKFDSENNSKITQIALNKWKISDFQRLVELGLTNRLFEFLEISGKTPETSLLLENVNTFIASNLSSQEALFEKYYFVVKGYNAIAELNNLGKIQPISKAELQTYTAYLPQYIKYLNSLESLPDSAAQISSFVLSKNGNGNSTNVATNLCDSLYQNYVSAYNFWVTSHPNFTPPTFYSIQDFQSRNFCCPGVSHLSFTQFINNFYSNIFYPPILTSQPPCDNPNTDPCQTRYDQYIQAVNGYNSSSFAQNSGHVLTVPFDNFQQFSDFGYCDCVLDYIRYLQEYYSEQNNVTLPDVIAPPVSIKDYPGCGKSKLCSETYINYVNAISIYGDFAAMTPGYPDITVIPADEATFVSEGYCICANAYISYINGIVSGVVTNMIEINQRININTFCVPPVIPCAKASVLDDFETPEFISTAQDPCSKYRKDLALANAKYLYGQYVAAQKSYFINNYNGACLKSKEDVFRKYGDKEFHYTLYYYDQAGNIVRTIPPEGLDTAFYTSIRKHTDVNAIKVRNDRYSKTKSVVVKHSMPSIYVYNTLNNLIKQNIPDHDPMANGSLDYDYPLGLDTSVSIVKAQFSDESNGFIVGNEKVSYPFLPNPIMRGKVFSTNDQGQHFYRSGAPGGTDITAMQFLTISNVTYGFAVGSNGAIYISKDEGSNWDLYPLHELTLAERLNDLKVIYNASGQIELLAVGNNGKAILATFNMNGSAQPIFTDWSIGGVNSISDVSGANTTGNTNEYMIVVYDAADRSSRFLKRDNQAGTTVWTDVTALKLTSLNKIRYLKGTTEAYCAGADGNLIWSIDEGHNWKLIETGLSGNILDLYFANNTNGIAVVEENGSGRVLKTFDGGRSWEYLDPSPATNYRTISPYFFSATLDRVTVNGASQVVRKVAISTPVSGLPSIGMSNAGVNVGNSTTINDVSCVYYNNSARIFAMAAGANGEVYYSSNFESNQPNWNLAVNIGQGGRKIALNIATPNANAFFVEAVILKDGTLPNGAKPCFVKSTNQISLSNLNGSIVWNSADINNNNISYYDMSKDPHSTSSVNRAFLLGYDASLMASKIYSITLFNVQASSFPQAYSAAFNSVLLKNIAVNINQNVAVTCDNLGNIALLEPTTTGALLTSASANLFIDCSSKILPGKINELDYNGGNALAVGNDGFVCLKTGVAAFQLVETKTADHFTNFKKYLSQSSTNMLLLTSASGNLWYTNYLNFSAASKIKVSNVCLNDVAFGSVSNNIGTYAHIYCVGDSGKMYHGDFAPFLNGTVSNQLVFDEIYTNETRKVNVVLYSANAGCAITAGNGCSSYNLGTTLAYKNENWFANELTNLHFINADNGYVVGKKGLIRHTQDAGQTWQAAKPYFFLPSNVTLDMYAVRCTAIDTAIIGGTHVYLSNITGTTLQNTIVAISAVNSSKWIHDIDLSSEVSGFAVGTHHSSYAATASVITIANHLATNVSQIAGTPINGAGFYEVYAFKGENTGNFIAGGLNKTLYYYKQGSGLSSNVSWNALTPSTPFFGTGDPINSIDMIDENLGFLCGAASKLGQISIVHSTTPPQITINQKDLSSQISSVANPKIALNTVCVFDKSGPGVYIGGNYDDTPPPGSSTNLYKYNLKFSPQIGRFTDLFWYDKLGRLILSQNAEQAPDKYTYNVYDPLGRIVETGQKQENAVTTNKMRHIFGTDVNLMNAPRQIDPQKFQNWLNEASGLRTQVTLSFYDKPMYYVTPSANGPVYNTCGFLTSISQNNLKQRISSSIYQEVRDPNICNYEFGSHYNYDVSGNVKEVTQHFQSVKNNLVYYSPIMEFKKIKYHYDQVSNKVNRVEFHGAVEEDCHYLDYDYDAINRITEVKSSKNGVLWESDAKYFYYKHGPLARKEIGHDKIQGVDYLYTLHGWIKGVNSNKLITATDIGKDGASGVNSLFALDAAGYSLGYFKSSEDYTPINSSVWSATNKAISSIGSSAAPTKVYNNTYSLYNGNIANMATSLSEPIGPLNNLPPTVGQFLTVKPLINTYRYDQLNRIRYSASWDNFNNASNTWSGTNNHIYGNSFTYDGNGNIQKQGKRDQYNVLFDSLTYSYPLGLNTRPTRNRLLYVLDAVTNANLQPDDFESMTSFYYYDKLGNLINDYDSQMDMAFNGGIIWGINGKPKEINHNAIPNSTKKRLKFQYDAAGNRIAKHVYSAATYAWEKSTYYLRDASGSLLATYEHAPAPPVAGIPQISYQLKERELLGSSKIGVNNTTENLVFYSNQTVSNFKNYTRLVGKKEFEIANHLGNVLTTFCDFKIPVPTSGNLSVSYYLAKIETAVDYYPFGQAMPGRKSDLAGYRIGFNGMEGDQEVYGEGNFQNYGMRLYDSRLGRFISVDPMFKKYSWNSTYAFAENDVIRSIDLDGLEKYLTYFYDDKKGERQQKVVKWSDLFPGSDHGPKGTGSLDFYLDSKTKKWSQPYYHKSPYDVHPVLTVVKEMERKASERKGLVYLGEGVANGAKGLGVVTSVAGGPPGAVAGGFLYGAGEAISKAVTVYDMLVDLADGKPFTAMTKGLFMITGKIGGDIIGDKVPEGVKNTVVSTAVDMVQDEVEEPVVESVEKTEEEYKKTEASQPH